MKKAKKVSKYFTYAHNNIEGGLRNGSYCRQDGSVIVWYVNGDFMGQVTEVPDTMTEVSADLAKKLLPKCCK